nr:hypothetical protein [Streptomyces sp. S.PB5]
MQPFRRPESVAYVRRRAQRLTDAEADQLADAVQDLPLLLAQTAAWLDANAMPAKDYISMIRRGEASMIGIRISSDYPMGFQTSWSTTLNTLGENNPEAVELLHLFALFSPDAIPVRLMQAARPSDLPDHLAALAGDPIRWHTALRRLSESTAVRLDYVESTDAEPAVDRVSMHRLYHSFLVSTLTEERREALSAAGGRGPAAPGRHPRVGPVRGAHPAPGDRGGAGQLRPRGASTGPELHRVHAGARREPGRAQAVRTGREPLAGPARPGRPGHAVPDPRPRQHAAPQRPLPGGGGRRAGRPGPADGDPRRRRPGPAARQERPRRHPGVAGPLPSCARTAISSRPPT